MDPAQQRNPFYTHLSTDSSHTPIASSSSSQYTPSISRPAFGHLASPSKGKPGIEQLNRLTLVLDATADAAKGGGSGIHSFWPALITYDLLAVQPVTSNQFNAACLTYTELKPGGQTFDIISLDLSSSPRLPFYLKRSTVGKALDSGAVFEVCYSEGLAVSSASAAGQKREDRVRNLISNTRDLLRVTSGGKGVILSSGAASVLGLRSPSDVANLAALFGFHPQRAREALSQTCRQIVQRAHARRSFRGVVALPKVVSVATSSNPSAVAAKLPPTAAAAAAAIDPDPSKDLQDLLGSVPIASAADGVGKKRKGANEDDDSGSSATIATSTAEPPSLLAAEAKAASTSTTNGSTKQPGSGGGGTGAPNTKKPNKKQKRI